MKYLFDNILEYIKHKSKKNNIPDKLSQNIIDIYYCFYLYDEFWYHNSFSPQREKILNPLKYFEHILTKMIEVLLNNEKNNEYAISSVLYYCNNLAENDFYNIFVLPEINKNKIKVEPTKYINVRKTAYESWKQICEYLIQKYRDNHKIKIFIQLYKEQYKSDILVK